MRGGDGRVCSVGPARGAEHGARVVRGEVRLPEAPAGRLRPGRLLRPSRSGSGGPSPSEDPPLRQRLAFPRMLPRVDGQRGARRASRTVQSVASLSQAYLHCFNYFIIEYHCSNSYERFILARNCSCKYVLFIYPYARKCERNLKIIT